MTGLEDKSARKNIKGPARGQPREVLDLTHDLPSSEASGRGVPGRQVATVTDLTPAFYSDMTQRTLGRLPLFLWTRSRLQRCLRQIVRVRSFSGPAPLGAPPRNGPSFPWQSGLCHRLSPHWHHPAPNSETLGKKSALASCGPPLPASRSRLLKNPSLKEESKQTHTERGSVWK